MTKGKKSILLLIKKKVKDANNLEVTWFGTICVMTLLKIRLLERIDTISNSK